MEILVLMVDGQLVNVADPVDIGKMLSRYVIDEGKVVRIERSTQPNFDEVITDIRLRLLTESDFVRIQTTHDKVWTNPYYFHLHKDRTYAMQVYEGNNHVEYSRIDISEAIKAMSRSNVELNEILEDVCELRGIPEYTRLVDKHTNK